MMKPILSFISNSLILLALVSPSQASDQDTEEGEIWTQIVLEAPFLELKSVGQTRIRFEEGNRWEDDYSEFYRNHHQVSVIFPIPGLEGWTWEPVYRNQTDEPGSDRQTHTDRYMFHLNWKKKEIFGSEWDFSFRNRWEVLDEDTGDEETRRTRFKGTLTRDLPTLTTNGENWRFWLSNEIFYDWTVSHLNENRLAAGVTVPVCENLDLSIGGQWRTEREENDGASWTDDHMLLLNLKYNLP